MFTRMYYGTLWVVYKRGVRMRVDNVKVYDLEESIIASGYPMRTTAEMRTVEDKDIKEVNSYAQS